MMPVDACPTAAPAAVVEAETKAVTTLASAAKRVLLQLRLPGEGRRGLLPEPDKCWIQGIKNRTRCLVWGALAGQLQGGKW
jgi:hypothetical protein